MDNAHSGALHLPLNPAAPAQARRQVRSGCRGRTSTLLAEDATLAVSELVTNAVRHGSPPITLLLHIEPTQVFLAVCDEGDAFDATPRSGSHVDLGGRGLALVEALSDQWSVAPCRSAGKSVWCVLTEGHRAASRPGSKPTGSSSRWRRSSSSSQSSSGVGASATITPSARTTERGHSCSA